MLSSGENVILPLSAAQRETWFAEQKLGPGNRVYKIGEYVEIYGPVDPVSFETALRRAVCEADSLRVRIVERREGPGQVVDAFVDWLLPVVDVSGEADPPTAALNWMTADVSRPMDLTRGRSTGSPPWRRHLHLPSHVDLRCAAGAAARSADGRLVH